MKRSLVVLTILLYYFMLTKNYVIGDRNNTDFRTEKDLSNLVKNFCSYWNRLIFCLGNYFYPSICLFKLYYAGQQTYSPIYLSLKSSATFSERRRRLQYQVHIQKIYDYSNKVNNFFKKSNHPSYCMSTYVL